MSKEFKIEYHGCGACFWDGNRPLISKYKSVCQNPTTDPFWKEIQHVKNVPCTRFEKVKAREQITHKKMKYKLLPLYTSL